MKKSIIIFGLLFSIISITLVAAAATLPAPTALPGFLSDQLLSGKLSFLTDLLIGTGSAAEIITRVLLVMLLTAVLFQPAFNLLGKKSGIAFLVAFLISILGIRFFPANQIEALLLPSGALAVAVATVIPFLLLAYLLEWGEIKEHKIIRKIGWACIAGAFIYLWSTRFKDLGDISYIYGVMALLSVALLLFDGTLQEQLTIAKLSKTKSKAAYREILDLEDQLKDDYERLAKAKANPNSSPNAIKDLERAVWSTLQSIKSLKSM